MARRRTAPTALVAAASRPLKDTSATVPKGAAQWQAEAWTMFDEVGEVKYACNLAGDAMARLRLYVAIHPGDQPDTDPVPVLTEADDQNVDPDLAVAAAAELARLGGTGALPELLRSLNINLEVAGELWLVGWDERSPGEPGGPRAEQWEVRSVSEVSWSGASGQRTAKVAAPEQAPREVVPERDAIIRIWVRHPRFGDLADSNLRGVLSDCRALLALEQQGIAETRSRMSAGAFTVPNELTISNGSALPTPEGDADTDPFLVKLEEAMIGPVEDLTSPSSVAPFIIRGPAEYLQPQYLRRIDLGRQTADIEARIEQRVQRLARGMNLPPEAVLGHQATTYANAAQVDQDTFEDHYEPRARLLADSLTLAYLRPGLIDAGWPPDQVQRLFVWYDAALLVGSPDTDANADAAFDNQAISWAAYRRAKGFSEADAPTEVEQLQRAGLMRGILTADLTTQLLNLLSLDPDAPAPQLAPPPPPGGGQGPEQQAEAALWGALLAEATRRGLVPAGAAPFRPGSGSHRAAAPQPRSRAAGHRPGDTGQAAGSV
jgi:hypothetical protein